MTTDRRVLHALRCGGFVGLATLSGWLDLPETAVEEALLDLEAQGLVVGTSEGAFAGWGPTARGRAEAERRALLEVAETQAGEVVERAFAAFLELNPDALETCTAWQLRARAGALVDNHHDDPSYDGRVLRRLRELLDRLHPVLGDLAEPLPRFERYGRRLDAAWERARGGDVAAVTDTTDSFHTAWFQLHEDLLVTLGRPRW